MDGSGQHVQSHNDDHDRANGVKRRTDFVGLFGGLGERMEQARADERVHKDVRQQNRRRRRDKQQAVGEECRDILQVVAMHTPGSIDVVVARFSGH